MKGAAGPESNRLARRRGTFLCLYKDDRGRRDEGPPRTRKRRKDESRGCPAAFSSSSAPPNRLRPPSAFAIRPARWCLAREGLANRGRTVRCASLPAPGDDEKLLYIELSAVATEAIAEIIESDVAAEKVLGRHLRRLGRRINNEQRATLARRVLGVSVLRKRLAYIADVIAGPGDRAADLLALYILYHEDRREEELHTEVRSFLSAERFDALAGLDLEAQVWPLLREKAVGMHALATEASLPVWLLQRWASQGVSMQELSMLAQACNAIPPVFLRANTLARPRQARGRADGAEGRNALMATLRRDYNLASRASSLSPWGVELVGGRPPTGLRLAAWEQGMFEVQDVGSQVVAMATNASRGDLVVDFCAGNGGKTLAMAAMVGREGLVVAHDVEVLRLKQLCGSLARARVHPDSVQVMFSGKEVWLDKAAGSRVRDPQVEEWRRGWSFVVDECQGARGADVVLVDAPCSSLGVLRRHPSLRWQLDEKQVESFPQVQLDILLQASDFVREGGTLVYATCSLDAAENTGVAEAFEASKPQFSPLPFPADFPGLCEWPRGSGDGCSVRGRRWLVPHVHGSDGFFIARWCRGEWAPTN